MTKLCTIIAIPEVIIEGSTYDVLDKGTTHIICHDGENRIFRTTDKDAIDPLFVDTLLPVYEGEFIDALVYALAPYLFADDRGRAIHIEELVVRQLYRHPAYQLYCGNYETVEALNIDYKKVFGVDVDDLKDLETLNAESRILLKQVLT